MYLENSMPGTSRELLGYTETGHQVATSQYTRTNPTFTTSFNVLTLGGSRNIGYYASLQLLAAGATVTFLLRNKSTFDNDADIQSYIDKGKAFLTKGDALVESDVEYAWQATRSNGNKPVDLLLFTVGDTPKFELLKETVITPANLVTQSLLNVLCTMPLAEPQPRIIVISSEGTTRASRAAAPFYMKPVYGYIIKEPLKDKIGAERVLSHVAGWNWPYEEPLEEIIGRDWMNREGLPRPGDIKRVLVVRPTMVNDGVCLAERGWGDGVYTVSENFARGWNISRKDVAYFVVDAALNRWHEFENKYVSISY